MARKPLTAVFINVALGSSSTTREFGAGDVVQCDSGLYVYGQANGAIAEGYLAKFVEGTYDFDTVTTAESASTQTQLGVCVAAGGLADNYWGWFWRGMGNEEVYVTTTIAVDTQLTTHTSAGQASTGGDNVYGLFTNESSGSGGLTNCRCAGLLSTNFTVAAA